MGAGRLSDCDKRAQPSHIFGSENWSQRPRDLPVPPSLGRIRPTFRLSPVRPVMLQHLEQLIRIDPAARGLISSEPRWGPLAPGHLTPASLDLARRARRVVLVTGFYIPLGTPPAPETDGPLGTTLLAEVLLRGGVEVELLTDRLCAPALRVCAEATGLPPDTVCECPFPRQPDESATAFADWERDFTERAGRAGVTHLVAIERVGPAHFRESVWLQSGGDDAVVLEFDRRVQPGEAGHCHNMRGVPIDEYTAPLHRLFERWPEQISGLQTIGVGDGANEIGMGSLRWDDLARRLSGDHAGRVPCRVGCTWTVVCGVSNWGGYALAAGFAHGRGRADLLRRHTPESQERVLAELVRRGPAVDGVTRQQTPTVDGLDFPTYIEPWRRMREALAVG